MYELRCVIAYLYSDPDPEPASPSSSSSTVVAQHIAGMSRGLAPLTARKIGLRYTGLSLRFPYQWSYFGVVRREKIKDGISVFVLYSGSVQVSGW